MNRIIYLGCVITLLAGVVGCEKDPKVDATSISIQCCLIFMTTILFVEVVL